MSTEAPQSIYRPCPMGLGLGPLRDSGLDPSLGVFLGGLVKVANDATAGHLERDRARAALRDASRLAAKACALVRAELRRGEEAREAARQGAA